MQTNTQHKFPTKFLVAGLIIAAVVAWLAVSGARDSKSYYVTITELQGMGPKAYTRHLRVAGNVQPGSITHVGTNATFTLLELVQNAEGQLPGRGAAAGYVQGRRPGARYRYVRQRWRLPRNAAASQVRQQVRARE